MSNELCPPERPGRTGVLSLFLLGLKPRTQNPEPRTQNPEPRTQNPELRTQNPELRTQNSEPRTQNPELRTQNSEPRTHLFAASPVQVFSILIKSSR